MKEPGRDEEADRMADTLVGVTDARRNLRELLDGLDESRDVVILKRNQVVGVIVHPAKLERLTERVDDLEDYVAALENRLEPEATIPHEEIRRRHGSDRLVAAPGY